MLLVAILLVTLRGKPSLVMKTLLDFQLPPNLSLLRLIINLDCLEGIVDNFRSVDDALTLVLFRMMNTGVQ